MFASPKGFSAKQPFAKLQAIEAQRWHDRPALVALSLA